MMEFKPVVRHFWCRLKVLLGSLLYVSGALTIVVIAVVIIPSNLAWAEGSIQSQIKLPVNITIDLTKPLHSDQGVVEPYRFHGVASYLNDVRYYVVKADKLQHVAPDQLLKLGDREIFAAVGRLNALIIRNSAVDIFIGNTRELMLKSPGESETTIAGWLIPKSNLEEFSPRLGALRYAQLLAPIAWLAGGVEWLLVAIQTTFDLEWGVALIIFAIVIKLLLLPVNRVTKTLQDTVNKHQAEMKPRIAQIKQSYHGEEAHNRIMAIYRERRISPFYALKPMLGLFIQLPILVAVFNALGEMHQFSSAKFLWIQDLSRPDSLTTFGSSVPFFGDTVNAIPILMVAWAGYSALRYSDPYATNLVVTRKRFQLLVMGILFFLVFYPFPAVMALYWLLANLLYSVK